MHSRRSCVCAKCVCKDGRSREGVVKLEGSGSLGALGRRRAVERWEVGLPNGCGHMGKAALRTLVFMQKAAGAFSFSILLFKLCCKNLYNSLPQLPNLQHMSKNYTRYSESCGHDWSAGLGFGMCFHVYFPCSLPIPLGNSTRVLPDPFYLFFFFFLIQ